MEMNRKLIIVLFLLFTVNIILTYYNTMAVADLQFRMVRVEDITFKLADAVVKMNDVIQAIVGTLDYILELIGNLATYIPTADTSFAATPLLGIFLSPLPGEGVVIPSTEVIIILGYVLTGVIGAASRMFVQIYRDGWSEWRAEMENTDILVRLLLGAVAGWLSYLLVLRLQLVDHITAWALGYVAPDVVENIAEHFDPSPKEDDEQI